MLDDDVLVAEAHIDDARGADESIEHLRGVWPSGCRDIGGEGLIRPAVELGVPPRVVCAKGGWRDIDVVAELVHARADIEHEREG